MTWNLTIFGTEPQQTRDRAIFTENLQLLPRAFSSLSRLYLTFHKYMFYQLFRAYDHPQDVEQIVLEPIARVVATANLQECVVTLPENIQMPQHKLPPPEIGAFTSPEPWNNGALHFRLWYPFSENEAQGQRGKGYWVAYVRTGSECDFNLRALV